MKDLALKTFAGVAITGGAIGLGFSAGFSQIKVKDKTLMEYIL